MRSWMLDDTAMHTADATGLSRAAESNLAERIMLAVGLPDVHEVEKAVTLAMISTSPLVDSRTVAEAAVGAFRFTEPKAPEPYTVGGHYRVTFGSGEQDTATYDGHNVFCTMRQWPSLATEMGNDSYWSHYHSTARFASIEAIS